MQFGVELVLSFEYYIQTIKAYHWSKKHSKCHIWSISEIMILIGKKFKSIETYILESSIPPISVFLKAHESNPGHALENDLFISPWTRLKKTFFSYYTKTERDLNYFMIYLSQKNYLTTNSRKKYYFSFLIIELLPFVAKNENLHLRKEYDFLMAIMVHFACKIKLPTFFVLTVL